MVTPPSIESRANDKGLQLRLVASLGLSIPETLITNSFQKAREFCLACPEVIFKLLNPPWINYGAKAICIYSNLLGQKDIDDLEQLQHCPGIFQRRISKRFDLRVTKVGNRLFPVEIHSQGTANGKVDFRKALSEDMAAVPHLRHELPGFIETKLLRLARKLGLHYCAIDMVVTPEGDYVFLEVNPSGQFGWIEHLTGLPITEELTQMLLRGHP